jgi:predicted ATPase
VTQVALSPLRVSDSRIVVQAVPGTASLPEARLQAIVAQAGGNPFFLEELAWHAVEQGGRDTPGAVPETVHAVVAARIDRLPPEAKRLLQTAAVIGPEVPVPLLQTIAEQPEEILQLRLAHLQATEFLYETRLFPDQVYTFKHALTHEVAYNSLLLERRRVLHARLVEALEALTPERGAEQVERLGYHALRSEVWDKAVTYYQQAGAKAFAASAYQAAVWCWEQVLEALAHLPSARTTREQAVDLRLQLHAALVSFAQWEQTLMHLRAAETVAAELGDHRRLGRVYRCIASDLRQLQELDPALTYCQRAHAMATALQGVPLDQSSGSSTHPAIQARVWLLQCLRELGEFAAGMAYGDEAYQMAEALGRPYERTHVAFRVG